MRFSISRMRCSIAFEVVPESGSVDWQPTAQRLNTSVIATETHIEGIRRFMSSSLQVAVLVAKDAERAERLGGQRAVLAHHLDLHGGDVARHGEQAADAATALLAHERRVVDVEGVGSGAVRRSQVRG